MYRDDTLSADRYTVLEEDADLHAAEAAFIASLPACTDPSGHVEGFAGFCRHCGVDILFEDDDE